MLSLGPTIWWKKFGQKALGSEAVTGGYNEGVLNRHPINCRTIIGQLDWTLQHTPQHSCLITEAPIEFAVLVLVLEFRARLGVQGIRTRPWGVCVWYPMSDSHKFVVEIRNETLKWSANKYEYFCVTNI